MSVTVTQGTCLGKYLTMPPLLCIESSSNMAAWVTVCFYVHGLGAHYADSILCI